MRLAIPTFGERISPRFDCAAAFLVVTLKQGEITERIELRADDWAPHERINRLVELDVDTVICGGIDRWSATSLASVGVAVHAWRSGTIEKTLEVIQCGGLSEPTAVVGDARCGTGRVQRRGRRRHGRCPSNARRSENS